MELFSANYEENTRALDDLLGVGRCFDMISRDLYVGDRRARLWVVDGYGDDAVIERMLSFWLPLRDVSDAQTMQQFIDRYITFSEVNAEQSVETAVTSVFLGKLLLLIDGFDADHGEHRFQILGIGDADMAVGKFIKHRILRMIFYDL